MNGGISCTGAVTFNSASDIQFYSDVIQTSPTSSLTINADTDSGGQGDLTVHSGYAIRAYGDVSSSISILANDVFLDGSITLGDTPLHITAGGSAVRICIGKERIDDGTWNIAG